eukprot:TRINITY_DN24829_c0_g1_i10.p1 TRINITY_DN24829_c0_g1~~TRINITY_DN24829_c0_g1_i10.p1  ORF type:complete len:374 (-),score=51.37 TRINITY_DN24829_c0_g1_i10:730-1851(-)
MFRLQSQQGTLACLRAAPCSRAMASTMIHRLPDDVEVHLARTQLEKDFKGVIPVLAMLTAFSAQQFYNGSFDLCYSSLTLNACASASYLYLHRLSKVEDSKVVASSKLAEKILMVVRVLVHAFCAYTEDGGASALYCRIFSLFGLPIAAARSCRDRRNYIAFLMAHNCIVAFRFWSSWNENVPWIVGTLLIQMLLLDILAQLHEQHAMRAQLSDALDNVKRVSEGSVKASFDVFCDVTVQLDESFRCKQAASLSKVLDTPTNGDVCHFPGLLNDAHEMVELSNKLDALAEQVRAHTTSDLSGRLSIEPLEYTFRTHCASRPLTLFPVSLLDCKGEVSFLVGICREWKQSSDLIEGKKAHIGGSWCDAAVGGKS